MAKLTERINGLTDDEARTVLVFVLERQGLAADPFAVPETESCLREALAQSDLADVGEVPATTPTAGDLARTTLIYLAERDENGHRLVEEGVSRPPRVGGRVEPTTIAIGALILLAFHADVKLERQPGTGWHFHFRVKPLKESAIAKVLGQLMATYLGRSG